MDPAEANLQDLPALSDTTRRLLALERESGPPPGAYERIAARLPMGPPAAGSGTLGAAARYVLAVGAVALAGYTISRVLDAPAPPAAMASVVTAPPAAAGSSAATRANTPLATLARTPSPGDAPATIRPGGAEGDTQAEGDPQGGPAARRLAEGERPAGDGAARAAVVMGTAFPLHVRRGDPSTGVGRRPPALDDGAAAVAQPHQAPSVAAVPAGSTATEEDLLRRARAAVRGGAPARALPLLREHRRSYTKGRLAEERDALMVIALAKTGRKADASKAAARFLAQHPSSVHRAVVEDAVGN